MMDGNNIPDLKVTSDVDKLTDVARSLADSLMEVLKLLPTPIPADSKVYESLEAIRGVPLECLAKNNTDIGVQVDFINQDPETIIGEANTSDEYKIINITSNKHFDAEISVEIEMEPKQDNVLKSDKVMGIKNYDSEIEPQVNETFKLQHSECDTSNVESDQETDIENETETISMKSSNSNSTLTLENYLELEDTLLNTDTNVEVDIPDDLEKQDIKTDVTFNRREIKIQSIANEIIENTIKQVKSNLQQSSEIKTNEEKPPLNSTLEVKTSSIEDSILNLVKPKNYKPKLREDVKIFGSIEDVKSCLQIAEKAMTEHKYDKAKCMAKKAERIHPAPAARALLEQRAKRERVLKDHQDLVKINADSNPESQDSTKNRRAEGMRSMAQDAFSQGDMTKAEKLAKRAQKFNPSEETERFLAKIRNKKENADSTLTEKKTSENLSESNMQSERIMTLFNKVKECLASGRLDDAEPALRDVRDCNPHPTEGVKSLESQIRAARASRSSTENAQISYPDVKNSYPEGKTSHSEVKPDDPKYRAKENAESFEGIARSAMAAGDYQKADKFLRKANAECPSEMSEKLLQDVQIELFSKDAKITNDNNNCDADNKKNYNSFLEMENMVKAESLYNQAKKELSNTNFDEAMELAVKSQKLAKLAKVEVLKRDIIKARSNHNRSEKNTNTNTFDGNCNDDLSKIDEAVSLVDQAKTEMKNKNIEKAEQLLIQSIKIRNSESVNELLKEIRQRESEHDQKPTISSNHDEAQKCMKAAEAAAKNKHFQKAEHFLEKSIRLAPSAEAKQMLDNVRAYLHRGKPQTNSESQQVHNNEKYLKADVEKCIEVAMNAISGEDFEKAERFLKKAARIQPTEKTKKLLEDVQKARQKMRLANEEKAVPLVCFAMTAIDEELFDIAEILLMNAWIKHKSGTAKNVIMQVKDIGRKKNKDSTPILDEQREIAAKYIETALRMMSEGQLESAECVLIIAYNTYATNEAKELLTHIWTEIGFNSNKNQCHLTKNEWKFTKISNEGNKKRDAFKYNSYVQMAQRAYETGDFNVAKAFLLEAENLYPNKDIKILLELVNEAKKCSLI